jgi:NADPH:quinone reductase
VRALVVRDGDLEVVERPDPTPGPGDVLVAVRAAGVNAADLLQRRGLYPAPPGWPVDVPGLELAGEVIALGEGVDPAWRGRRVCAVVGGGAQATHCVVPDAHLLAVPDDADWPSAGGFAEAATTAHDALVTQARVAPGERVLVSGAAGGVGVAAVQIAHLLGATVVASTRDATHHDALRALGADEVVTLEHVADLAPVDVVLELVGAAHLTLAQRALAPGARVVVTGVGAGARVEIDLLGLMTRRAHLTGATLRARSREEKAEVAARVTRDVVPWWAEGRYRVPITACVTLDDAAQAYETFAQPGKLGKVVLVVDP